MIRPRLLFLSALFLLILASIPASAQITIDTFAGGYIQSGVPAQKALLSGPSGITRDLAGNLVFCDGYVIRRIQADGTIETIAGIGVPGYGGDGGPAVKALLASPAFPKYDQAGNLYFADIWNYRIRRIDTNGIISTVAGTGIQGLLGADGPATQAQIEWLTDLAVDTEGFVYFAEQFQQNLRRITPSGRIEVYAVCPSCDGPNQTSLAKGPAGNLYLSDGSRIFRISSDSVIHDFAGFGPPTTPNMGNGGPALGAPSSTFRALAADSSGNLYTEETSDLFGGNGGFIIRRIGTNGVINVVAGTFTGTSQGDGPALQTELFPNYGSGLTADANGTVTFGEDYRIRQLTTQSTIQTTAGGDPTPAPNGTAARNAWFIGPNSIAFDTGGDLYIGQTCIIQKIGSTGLLSTVAGTGTCSNTPPSGPALTSELTEVYSIAVDSHGQVYFADVSGMVYVVSTKGILSNVATIADGIFPKIAIDSQDRVYLVSAYGVFARITPGSAPQVVSSLTLDPSDIAIDPTDNVYVCCGHNNTIYRYTPDLQGSILSMTGSALETAIAVDAFSNIWQAASYSGLTKGTLPFGGGCCNYGDGRAAESAYILPSALAFAPNGDLYLLESGTNSVRRIHGSPPTAQPMIAAGGIVNAASFAGTAIAPGELISIFGSNFGPSGLDLATLQNNFVPAALNNAHVYFGATVPELEGRIAARSSEQINVFVPYDVASVTSIQVIVDVDGVTSTPVTVPVAASAFGIATANASGSGQGAIRNQDGSLNGHSNPAAPGSIITFYGTGDGVTTPALPDGALEISTPYSTTQAPVIVKFGEQTAQIQYAGAAPFEPTGVFQINAVVPTGLASGDVPITVSIAGISTTRTVTVSVQ